MPQAVYLIIRAIIQMTATLGAMHLAEKYFFPLLNRALEEVMIRFGVAEEVAKDIIANEVLLAVENIGMGVLTLRSKVPTKIAEKLGFTSKGWKKRILPASIKITETAKGSIEATAKALGGTLGKGILTMTGGLLVWNMLTDWVWIGNSLNFLPDDTAKEIQKRAFAIQDLINAPRSIIYSAEKLRRSITQQERELIKAAADEAEKQINDLKRYATSKFVLFGKNTVINEMSAATNRLLIELQTLKQMAGLIPPQPIKTIEIAEMVKEVFDGDTIKLSNDETVRLVGIDAPESTTEAGEKAKKYLIERLKDQRVVVKSDPDSLIDVYGRRLGVVYLNDVNINIEMLKNGHAIFYEFQPNALVLKKQWVAAAKENGRLAREIVPVKVFTGIVSQGTLGAPVEFTTRENDLIENIEELKDSAQNNLAPFLVSLPGRIIYEIKIVPSVITKDGFRRTGAPQRIISKYTTAGIPLFKTVVNKFAVLDIFILTERGARSKISSIVLGPTDAVKLQPKTNELRQLETDIKQGLFTNNTKDINGIETSQPIIIIAPPIQPTETITAPPAVAIKTQYKPDNTFYVERGGFSTIIYRATPEQLLAFAPANAMLTAEERKANPGFGVQSQIGATKLLDYGIDVKQIQQLDFIDKLPGFDKGTKETNSLEEFFGPVKTTEAATQPPQPSGSLCRAQTLFEWYSAMGQTLPPVTTRAITYEQLNLGLTAYYTGTAEQNTKLLNTFKRNNGCLI